MRSGHHILIAVGAVACGTVANAGEALTYRYDSLGRLVKVSRSGAVNDGVTSGYSYDQADNRTNVTVGTPGPTAGSPTVAGGGFESPDFGSGYGYRPNGGPAAFTGNAGLAGNGSAWGFALAPEGDQVAFLQTYGGSSAVALGVSRLTPGTAYAVTFHIAQRPGYGANPITVAFNGVALGTFTPNSTGFTAVTSAAFTAGASSGTLTFTGISYSGDTSRGLDNVTVATAAAAAPPPPPPPPPLPEPENPEAAAPIGFAARDARGGDSWGSLILADPTGSARS